MNDMFCRIGQKERCSATKCEWKKTFGNYCWLRPPETKEEALNSLLGLPKDANPFPIKKAKKKGRVVSNPKKYKEIKPVIEKIKKEINFGEKITTASQDDWIKKIKVLK
jgi:hypothetical protein